MKNTLYDVIIIGGGILGLATAFKLISKSSHIKLAIVSPELENCKGSGSVASGAMLGCFGEVTAYNLNSKIGQYKHNLTYKAKIEWANFIEAINESSQGISDSIDFGKGTFIIANAKSGTIEDENFQAIINSLETFNEKYEYVDYSDIQGFCPESFARPFKTVFLPEESFIDSRKLLQKIKNLLLNHKHVTFINDHVGSLSKTNQSDFEVSLSGETIKSYNIVVAAGAYSSKLINCFDELKTSVPMIISGTGNAFIIHNATPRIEHVIRTPNRSFSCGLHVVPNQAQLYVGATNVLNLKPQIEPTLSDAYFLIECLLEQINHHLESNKIISTLTGNRAVSIDTFPLVGETSIKGLYLIAGGYRDGFHLSPVFSSYIADLILDITPKYDVSLFKPQRKLICQYSQQEAITQTIKYYLAVGHEHSMKIPKVGWVNMIEEMITDKVNSLYSSLKHEFIIPPDLFSIIDLDRSKMLPFIDNYLNSYRSFE